MSNASTADFKREPLQVNVKSHGSDRYGRILGEVYSPDSINEKMVTTGMAWAYRYHGKPTNEKYVTLENKARSDKKTATALHPFLD